jgi:hypothetical protein
MVDAIDVGVKGDRPVWRLLRAVCAAVRGCARYATHRESLPAGAGFFERSHTNGCRPIRIKS